MQLKFFFPILSIGGECYTFTNQAPKEMIQKTLEDPPEEFGNYLYSILSTLYIVYSRHTLFHYSKVLHI